MSQQSEQPKFIVDRSLGSEHVPNTLREAGFELVTLEEVYGQQSAAIKEDKDWLEDAGKSGLVVLTKDKKIKRKPAEVEMVMKYQVRCFCVTRSVDLKSEDLARMFITNKEAIFTACTDPGPFFYAVRSSGIERLPIPQ